MPRQRINYNAVILNILYKSLTMTKNNLMIVRSIIIIFMEWMADPVVWRDRVLNQAENIRRMARVLPALREFVAIPISKRSLIKNCVRKLWPTIYFWCAGIPNLILIVSEPPAPLLLAE